MPKYYVAQVTVAKTYEVKVSASDENEAEIKAKEKVTNQTLSEVSSTISNVHLQFDGESNFEINQRIRHPKFGIGKILELSKSTNHSGAPQEKAKIEFETCGTKDILLSIIEEKVEIVE